jgi:ATP-binding cassette subfamily D (ALD) protein 3
MKEVLEDLEEGKYKRIKVTQNQGEEDPLNVAEPSQMIDNSLQSSAEVVLSDKIKFEGVPILSPNGDTLIPAMSFEIRPGMNLFITGPNGCGKSSLFRILGELWPAFGGKVSKPSIEKIFYIPQRPYLPNGSLRD